jgi:hypothetical protein
MYRARARSEHLHIVLPSYLMDFIEELAKKHHTSRAHEIMICVLIRYMMARAK